MEYQVIEVLNRDFQRQKAVVLGPAKTVNRIGDQTKKKKKQTDKYVVIVLNKAD